jgi:hypothetical protein
MNVLAVIDDSLQIFRDTHNRLLSARRDTVASIARRERVA